MYRSLPSVPKNCNRRVTSKIKTTTRSYSHLYRRLSPTTTTSRHFPTVKCQSACIILIAHILSSRLLNKSEEWRGENRKQVSVKRKTAKTDAMKSEFRGPVNPMTRSHYATTSVHFIAQSSNKALQRHSSSWRSHIRVEMILRSSWSTQVQNASNSSHGFVKLSKNRRNCPSAGETPWRVVSSTPLSLHYYKMENFKMKKTVFFNGKFGYFYPYVFIVSSRVSSIPLPQTLSEFYPPILSPPHFFPLSSTSRLKYLEAIRCQRE